MWIGAILGAMTTSAVLVNCKISALACGAIIVYSTTQGKAGALKAMTKLSQENYIMHILESADFPKSVEEFMAWDISRMPGSTILDQCIDGVKKYLSTNEHSFVVFSMALDPLYVWILVNYNWLIDSGIITHSHTTTLDGCDVYHFKNIHLGITTVSSQQVIVSPVVERQVVLIQEMKEC